MRSVRVFYKKTGRMKFVSHLDMSRFMSRLITRSGIPVWYTEGFNQHLYMNFALPLSLGFESLYEIMEIRLMKDDYSCEDCLSALKKAAVEGIEFSEVLEEGRNMKEIGFADFELEFEAMPEGLGEFLSRDSVICLKKGKKGKTKEVDIIPKIRGFEIGENILKICLVAGTEDNLNPNLVLSAFFEQTKTEPVFYSVTRTGILDKEGKLFK